MRIISIILLLSFPMLINAQPDRIYKLNRGTKIQVRTGNELAGNSLLKGDILLFEVTNDVYAHGEKVISRNAKVYGTVIELEEKKSSKKIRFDFSIDSLFMDDGRKVDLNLAYEIDSKVTKGSFRGKPSLIESGTIFNAIVQNDLIVKYGYSSQKINEILNSFENSNINTNYENLYSVNDEIKKLSNTTYKVSSEKIQGYIGDKKYQIDGDSEFSLVAEFIKYLNSNNQSERDESFTRIFDYMYGISSQEMQFKDKFEYTYIEELNLFFVQNFSQGNIYVFDPIYGPLQFVKDKEGFNLFNDQVEDAVRLDVIHNNSVVRRQDPRQRNNYYKIPDKYYVINPSGKFQNNGYVLSEGMQSWNKGSIYIHDEELPEFGYTSITSDVEDKYRIGSDYYIQEGTKQYRRYPTYDEKIQIFQAGGISKADVNNPNYYFLEKESDKKIYYSKFLNHNGYTLLPTKYEEIKSLGNNLFLTKINNRLGLVYATPKSLKTGKFRIFDNVFEEIIKNNDGTFKVKLNGDYFVVDFYGNILM